MIGFNYSYNASNFKKIYQNHISHTSLEMYETGASGSKRTNGIMGYSRDNLCPIGGVVGS